MLGPQSIRPIYKISIYKLGDVGITSNLIGSLSLTNGHCLPPGPRVNSRFAEVNENDILRMQDITIANDTSESYEIKNESFHR